MLHRRCPSAESVTASRELSRQGVAAMELGQWQEAEELLKKALAASPGDASTHRSMAEVLWHRNARPEALGEIEEAVKLDPTNAVIATCAGEMSLSAGDHDIALAHAEQAIRSDSQLPAAWALRGRCFQKMNQPDRALADLQHALEFAPNSSDVLLDVAVIYRQRGQAARCLTTLHSLLDTYTPGDEPQSVLMLQGLTLMDLGRPQQATESLAAAAHRGKPSADVLCYLAQAYSAAGQIELATTTAHQALALNGSHQASRQLLTQLAARSAPGETLPR